MSHGVSLLFGPLPAEFKAITLLSPTAQLLLPSFLFRLAAVKITRAEIGKENIN